MIRRVLLPCAFLLLSCSGKSGSSGRDSGAPDTGPTDAGPTDAAAEDDGMPPDPPTFCETLDLPERPFSDGPYGIHRHETAEDFTVELVDGSTWNFREEWTGCDSYVFIPDSLPNSALDPTSIWERDVDRLVADSPRNVHYFFVSRATQDYAVSSRTRAMSDLVDATLAGLGAEDAEHWRTRLHVVAQRAAVLGNWLADVLDRGHGRAGFAIDRFQRVRGVGSFADVNRYSAALAGAGHWPWEANLAYASNEARHFDYEADREERLGAVDATVVDLWAGEVLEEFAETEVDLPSAEVMATFDTFEIDVTARCPDEDSPEFGNCGAWDYLAHLFVYDGDGERIELGRFITSYHREGRFLVDVTPMLVHLVDGGTQTFRWEFAPSWNGQPTATWLSMRFSNQGKGYRPTEAHFLWSGGAFNSAYNDGRTPTDVAIPADAERVDLWAIITGHGGATRNCSEFCNHQHEFTVNGNVHLRDHPAVGNQEGCVAEIENGTVPNQWGTWWFGRGGWCPGQQVDPWVVDVSDEVSPGESATVSYRGLFAGDTPLDDSGSIVMASYLVVYR